MAGGREETTLYVIAYDIPGDRRRTKVHNALCGYGKWTQYSLFECWLTRKQLLELQAKLGKHINDQEDSVRFYPLCAGCQGKVMTIGSERPQEDMVLIV
jgi:CRISPR-associated protein Cas2